MSGQAIITNEDIGILFHPKAVELRQRALAFLVLRIIHQSQYGLSKEEIDKELHKKFNWQVRISGSDDRVSQDTIESTLFYLQNPSSSCSTAADSSSIEPYIRVRLRYQDRQYVFRVTEKGARWVKNAQNEYEKLIAGVRKTATEFLNQRLKEELIEITLKYPALMENIENLVIDKLKRIAFEEAETVLKTLNFLEADITTFKRYYASVRDSVSNRQILKSINDMSKEVPQERRNEWVDRVQSTINEVAIGQSISGSWESFLHAYSYNALLFTLLPYIPGTSLNNYLSEQIQNSKICLDTNVLIAIILDFDRDHTVAMEIMSTMSELGVKVFWHDLAEEEIKKKFVASREAVSAIKLLPPSRRSAVINAVWDEGYISTFFNGLFTSTVDMERTALRKLQHTRKGEFYAKPNGTHFIDAEATLGQMDKDITATNWAGVRDGINSEITKKFEGPLAYIHIKHDREILLWIYGLRHISKDAISPGKENRYLAHHWVASLDKKLIGIAVKLRNDSDPNLNQPLSISLRTLRMMIDPADVLRAIRNSSIPKTLEERWMDDAVIKEHRRNIYNLIKRAEESHEKEDMIAVYIRESAKEWQKEMGE